ncbi:MAG: hemerythrin domain-containing protein [Alphaproteobacteria bacterium]
MPNAIELLEEDHDKVRGLLKKLTDSDNGDQKERDELLKKIRNELHIHTRLEEEIFYPAFREADEKAHGELYHESMEEHHIVEDMVIPDTEDADRKSAEFSGCAKVLRELVEHHAKDEEEEMFPKAKKALTKKQLEELGSRMESRKKELQDSL